MIIVHSYRLYQMIYIMYIYIYICTHVHVYSCCNNVYIITCIYLYIGWRPRRRSPGTSGPVSEQTLLTTARPWPTRARNWYSQNNSDTCSYYMKVYCPKYMASPRTRNLRPDAADSAVAFALKIPGSVRASGRFRT